MTTQTLSAQSLPDLVERLRQKSPSKPTGEVVVAEDQFIFTKDAQGRDQVTFTETERDRRLKRWEQVCLDFDYTEPLVVQKELQPYQSKLRDQLSLGRKNAILCGPPGTGKTTAAMWALFDLHMAGRHVLASRFSQFKTKMEPRYCEENEISPETVASWYRRPEFLLLDELGYGDTEQTIKEHERRIFFDLVSVRESLGRRTWICSNVTRSKLHQLYGEATFSRVDGMGACIVGNFSKKANLRYLKGES